MLIEGGEYRWTPALAAKYATETGQFIHWYNGPIAEETRAQLPWLFDGDARWSSPPF